jgi:hypothetical protein
LKIKVEIGAVLMGLPVIDVCLDVKVMKIFALLPWIEIQG